MARGQVGFPLLYHDDLLRAQDQLQRSLAIGERHGDLGLQFRALCRLSGAALRRYDVEAVRALAPQEVAAGEEYTHPELVIGVKVCPARLAFQEQRWDDVLALTNEVDELYGNFPGGAGPQGSA